MLTNETIQQLKTILAEDYGLELPAEELATTAGQLVSIFDTLTTMNSK